VFLINYCVLYAQDNIIILAFSTICGKIGLVKLFQSKNSEMHLESI